MARTNQGVFHEIREKVKNLKDSFEQEVRLYFRCSDENELYRNVENCWDIGNDFYSTFAYSANEIYMKAKELEKLTGGILSDCHIEPTDFEIFKK